MPQNSDLFYVGTFILPKLPQIREKPLKSMTGGPHPLGWHPRVPTGAYLIFKQSAILHLEVQYCNISSPRGATIYSHLGISTNLAWISTRHPGYEYLSSAGAFIDYVPHLRFSVTLLCPRLITFGRRSQSFLFSSVFIIRILLLCSWIRSS